MNAQGTIVDRCWMTFSKRKKTISAKNLSANLISQRFGTHAVVAPNQVNSQRKQHFQKVLPWEHYALHLPQKVSNDDPYYFKLFSSLVPKVLFQHKRKTSWGRGKRSSFCGELTLFGLAVGGGGGGAKWPPEGVR